MHVLYLLSLPFAELVLPVLIDLVDARRLSRFQQLDVAAFLEQQPFHLVVNREDSLNQDHRAAVHCHH